MIKNIYIEPKKEQFLQLCERPKKNENDLDNLIAEIFTKVEKNGDNALVNLTSKFDKVDIETIKVPLNEIENALKDVPQSLKDAIQISKENITKFHQAQIAGDLVVETMQGVICKQKTVGIERVGLYIPGGTAPLFSTVLMLAIPAQLAGCNEIILCSPPDKEGNIHAAILYAAHICGIRNIFKVGGAQAIAAMSIGTETIPSVFKVFGPGNQYVSAAKQYAQKYGVGMDAPAGPSELLVYVDETSVPKFVASDLLSQAEHGLDSQVIVVSSDSARVAQINEEIVLQMEDLPRKAIAQAALENSKILIIKNVKKAFDFINEYGPEHLIIASDNYTGLIENVINAGSVFLGNYCPESAGDYASGTNHTLPTNGWAKSYSGVNIDSFSRKITFQEISKRGIQNLGNTIMSMAQHEGLEGHANAVAIRLEQLKSERL